MTAVTSQVTVTPQAWTSLGVTAAGGGVLVSASGPAAIAFGTAAPSALSGGHQLADPEITDAPVWVPTPAISTAWGISLTQGNQTLTVSLS